jgi:predicted TIM-barrel fold metal-dependent hydrolase
MTLLIDTHVHLFDRQCGFTPKRRYELNYDALPAHLSHEMTLAGVSTAVVVQPSFLGTDNSYLLKVIAESGGRFSGIAVVEPDISGKELQRLKAAGIIGFRLNCIGETVPNLAVAPYSCLVAELAGLGMILQIQAEGEQWPALEQALVACQATIVIDHFGRTPPGDASGGFESLMRLAVQSDSVYFKFSAPYRLKTGAATHCARSILDTVPIERILWGSDWPATQFEGHHTYQDTLAWLEDWVPRSDDREIILSQNPIRVLCGPVATTVLPENS